MPTYRSIVLGLNSQFDVETVPEYFPRPQEYYSERGLSGIVPPHIDEKTSTCNAYIPVFPGSQFWISYAVCPPVPDDQQFLFKLFINGTHIVSCSAGKEEGWKGKIVFGLYEREEDDGKKRIEKRALCFTPLDKRTGQWTDVTNAFDEGAYMEIRVHRAHGRKRVERKVVEFQHTEYGKRRQGIDLVNAGRAGVEQPKRFYKFALIDPTDRPFVKFRYYYRTWEQLRELDLVEEDIAPSGDVTEMSVIEPYDLDEIEILNRGYEADKAELDWVELDNDGVNEVQPTAPRAYVPSGAPDAAAQPYVNYLNEEELERYSGTSTMSQFYRLSVPPSCKFDPPNASPRSLPSIPTKSNPPDPSCQPHPAHPVDDWEVRTPSPVKSVRDGISTPPLGRRKGLMPTALMSAIATTWKRRGTPNTGSSNDTGSGTTSRSVS